MIRIIHLQKMRLMSIGLLITASGGLFGMEQDGQEQSMISIILHDKEYSLPYESIQHSGFLQEMVSVNQQKEQSIRLDAQYVAPDLWDSVIKPALTHGPDYTLKKDFSIKSPATLIALIKAADFLAIDYLRLNALKAAQEKIQKDIDYYSNEKGLSEWNDLDDNNRAQLIENIVGTRHIYWKSIDLFPTKSWFSRLFAPGALTIANAGNQTVFLGLTDGTILKKEEERISEFCNDNGVIMALLSIPERGWLISAGKSSDNAIVVRDIKTGKVIDRKSNKSVVTSMACNAAGTRLISGTYGGIITIWDISSGLLVERNASQCSGAINDIAQPLVKVLFLNSDTRIIATFLNGGVMIADIGDVGLPIKVVNSGSFMSTAPGIQLLPNSSIVYFSTANGRVITIDYTAFVSSDLKKAVIHWHNIEENRGSFFALSSDNKLLACAFNNTVALYEVCSSGSLSCIGAFRGDVGPISGIVFSSDNKQLIVASAKGVRVLHCSRLDFTLEQAICFYYARINAVLGEKQALKEDQNKALVTVMLQDRNNFAKFLLASLSKLERE